MNTYSIWSTNNMMFNMGISITDMTIYIHETNFKRISHINPYNLKSHNTPTLVMKHIIITPKWEYLVLYNFINFSSWQLLAVKTVIEVREHFDLEQAIALKFNGEINRITAVSLSANDETNNSWVTTMTDQLRYLILLASISLERWSSEQGSPADFSSNSSHDWHNALNNCSQISRSQIENRVKAGNKLFNKLLLDFKYLFVFLIWVITWVTSYSAQLSLCSFCGFQRLWFLLLIISWFPPVHSYIIIFIFEVTVEVSPI